MARVRAIVAIEVEQYGHRQVIPCGSTFEISDAEAAELMALVPPPIELADPPKVEDKAPAAAPAPAEPEPPAAAPPAEPAEPA